MASTDKLIRIILQLNDKASAGLDKAGNSVSKLSGKMSSVGKAMSIGITAPLVAVGVAGVKMASDLDAAMRNIQSVGRQTDEELSALSNTFLDMSTDMSVTVDSAQNLAEAFYDIQGSGFEGADAMKVLEAATKAASAGLTETAVASQGITAVLNSYGKSAEDANHISDLMFRTVDRGVGSFEELTGSMANVVGTASVVGVGFDEVSAALATMSKQGMSFSEASTSLNQAILAFLKPTEQMTAVISKLGFASGQAMIEQLGFAGAMQALAKETGGSAEQMAALFGNVRGLRAATALTGAGAQLFAEDLAAMGSAAGATSEAFAIQTKSFQAQMKNFKNVANEFLITIGNVIIPVLSKILGAITPIIKAFSDLPKPVQTAIVAFGAFLAVAGPLLIIASSLITAFGVVAPVVMTVVGAFMALNPVVLAVAAAVGIAILAFKNFGKIKEIIKSIPDAISKAAKAIASALFNMVKALIGGMIKGVKEMAGKFVNEIKNMANDAVNGVKSFFKISSPSKVTMEMGRQIARGFSVGFDKEGGLSGIASTIKKQAGALSSAAAVASSPFSGASGGLSMPAGSPFANMARAAVVGGRGGGNVNIANLNVPPGTSREQIDHIMKEIGKKVKQKGGYGLR